jgi:hypothetical protein
VYMGLFKDDTKVRYGSLIDIGSGSVLVAIIKSDPANTYPEIIWNKREYVPLRQIASINESAKHVMTSLVNALMLLDSEGRRVFQEKTGHNKLPETQVTIAAPWSYTITKSIAYAHEEPFTLSDELIRELLRTAHKKIESDISENEKALQLGLSVISRSLIGLSANGYTIGKASDQKIRSLRVVEASAVAQDYLIEALHDATAKVLPDTKMSLYSFILIYFHLFRHLFKDSAEYCLVDITYEATEIGIVRDGVLNYTTHTPFGSFSLAREIAAILDIPLEEAFGYMHTEDPLTLLGQYSPGKIADVKEVFRQYEGRLSSLFHETGDTLAIPKKIFLHGNLESEAFFSKRVGEGARLATNASHAMYSASTELVKRKYPQELLAQFSSSAVDTALLISAQFFHTKSFHSQFEQM